ncbi:MAG: gamma carbonic anhydrase family protein [Myxococcales bacterium]|nr:gamma carbonic anhydrase family protein [Myxococcales bacterium]
METILRSYDGVEPTLHESVWVAPGAVVVGDVTIGEDSSVFYGAVLRGDVEAIRIGRRTNIQDQATLHVTAGRFPTLLGDEITVGHRAVVHGCRVGDGALIGIGAIVLDGAEIGEEALVAAGAVVTPGQRIAPRMLALGMPAREVRALTADEIAEQRARTRRYVETARQHARSAASLRNRTGG